jgi:hypothetical protein
MRKVAPVPPSPGQPAGGEPFGVSAPQTGEYRMLDLVLIAAMVSGFMLLAGYGVLCDRL